VPAAFVLPTDPADPTLVERITAACVKSLGGFKMLREVRVVEEFPRATLEKISKAKLRPMLTGPVH
jgi:carnitine-CoA ligase